MFQKEDPFAGTPGESRMIDIAGSRMHVLDTGEGPAVMLGHSYLWDAAMWRPQIDVLSRRHRVIVPELWGHGRSGPLPPGTASLRDLARHHLAVLDHLGIEQAALVGLSIGGMWGAELALSAPHRISALAIMDSSLAPEPEADRLRYLSMLEAIGMQARLPDAIRAAIVPLFFSPIPGSWRLELMTRFDAVLREWDATSLVDSVVPIGRMILERRDAMPELPTLRMPAIVMTGERDLARPPQEGLAMAEAIGCAFVAIPGSGHISSLEAPDFVSDALVRFLSEWAASATPGSRSGEKRHGRSDLRRV